MNSTGAAGSGPVAIVNLDAEIGIKAKAWLSEAYAGPFRYPVLKTAGLCRS